jgi:hypothetical protein
MTKKPSVLVAAITTSLCLAATPQLFATSIGINFVETGNNGVQNGLADSLASGELAGFLPQTNWNNFGRWSTPITANDSLGLSTSVAFAWDSNNTWHNNGNPLATGNDKLMRGYLDATGQVNQGSFTSIFASNANKPIVYVTGLSSWLSSQSATSFDLIIYLDGDTTGRIGEYWVQSATGAHDNFTLGADLTPHLFGRDFGDFGGTFDRVDPSATSVGTAEDGNYILFSGISGSDTILLRTEEQTQRAPISGFQIVAVPEPSTMGLLGLSTLGVMMFRQRRLGRTM